MNITDTAFIIPSHPPHYHYIYNLINKLKESNISIDIYIVFSSQEHFNIFLQPDYIKPIIINGNINHNSIITFKKLFGLRQLINSSYDYFIVCDSEIMIIPENFTQMNITSKLSNIFINKQIYSSYNPDLRLTRKCVSLFIDNKIEYDKLIHETQNCSMFWWYSDIPVYKRDHLEEFFKRIGDGMRFDWDHFEYCIYQLYLILYHNFTVINTNHITNMKWSLEGLCTKDNNILDKLKEINYGFGWVNYKQWGINPEYFMNENTFIMYHLDR